MSSKPVLLTSTLQNTLCTGLRPALPVQIKVKVKDPGASGIKEKIKVREVAPGEWVVEDKYKGPDGKTHVKTRPAVGAEIPGAAAAVHAPGDTPSACVSPTHL